jgi:heme exporter protein C
MADGSGRRIVAPAEVRALIVALLAAAFSAWGLWEGWWRAPIESELKMSQKIFYFHAPLGMCTLALTVVAAGAAVAYLWKRREGADLLGEACMEVVLVSCGVVLVTGMLWAKPAWGDWFPWGEPRVTSMLVLFLIAMAYVALRSSIDEPDRRARLSAVLALVGAMDAVIAYMAIHLWNTTHPRVITAKGIGLAPGMKRAFFICIVAMALWTWTLVAARLRLARLRSGVERLEHEAQERLETA